MLSLTVSYKLGGTDHRLECHEESAADGVAVKFDTAKLPAILNSLETQNNGQKLVLEVAVRAVLFAHTGVLELTILQQHLGENVVRCIAMDGACHTLFQRPPTND